MANVPGSGCSTCYNFRLGVIIFIDFSEILGIGR